jgi:glutamine amidotransferase-like uncharacterized protein
MELGEFAGDAEPEFEGAVKGTLAVDADAGDMLLDGGVQTGGIFRGGGCFENAEGFTQGGGKAGRGEQSANRAEVISVF